MREIATEEYWNKRVKESPNLKDMIFRDPRREEFWDRVRYQLRPWFDHEVLDVCCGYGQFSDVFMDDKYTGIDVSDEMLKLAREKNPGTTFKKVDLLKETPSKVYDVIFEVNSLHSLGLTPQEFYEKFKGHAKVAIACLEADVFTIYQIY